MEEKRAVCQLCEGDAGKEGEEAECKHCHKSICEACTITQVESDTNGHVYYCVHCAVEDDIADYY